jgi:hypothetical protein
MLDFLRIPNLIPLHAWLIEAGTKDVASWNVRVTTFDSEGKPRIVRNFVAYEADKERAVELVRKRVPVYARELAKAVAEVAADELYRPTDEAWRCRAAWLDIRSASASSCGSHISLGPIAYLLLKSKSISAVARPVRCPLTIC